MVVSIWLLYVRHYTIGDALSRTATAKIMVLSGDPHLGSMGYYWMPLPTLTRIPFVLMLQPFGRAELAGPLTSAVFAALTIPVICAIGRTLKLSTALTVTIAITLAFNPVTMFIAANGMSESTFVFFLALTMYGYLRWRVDGAMTSLCILGLALGGAMASRFEALVITPAICVAVMLGVPKGRRLRTAAMVAFPPATVFMLWSLASLLIMGDWLFWKHIVDDFIVTPDDALWLPADRSIPSLARHDMLNVVALGPAVVLVVVGLLGFPRRWRTSIGVVGMILLLPIVITWQTHEGTSWDVPRFYTVIPMLVTVGVMWLVFASRSRRNWSVTFSVVGVVLLVAGSITGTVLIADVKRTSVEGDSVFFGAVLGRSPEDTWIPSDDGPGFLDILAPFRQMERDLVPSFKRGRTVALDTIIAVPFLVSDYPQNYIIPEDRDFEPIIADPIGRVDFIIRISSNRATGYGVLLDQVIAGADGGKWVHVGSYGRSVRLYEWVPTGSQPELVASACCLPQANE